MTSLRVSIPAAFAALALTACSFQMQAGGRSQNQPATNSTTPSTDPAPTTDTPAKKSPIFVATKRPRPMATSKMRADLLKRQAGGGGSSSGSSGTDEPRFVTGDTPFGGANGTDISFVGLIYFTDANATGLPAFDNLKPTGALFTNTLNVAANTTFNGFPGVDNRKDNFAIRYESPLVVTTEADYTIRIVSDDGAKLYIDDMLIVDNDGVKDGAAEKSGPVHLVAATHAVRIDYFHTTGPVALQVFVKPPATAEQLLGTKL